MTEGIILKGIGGFYYVDTPEGLIECKARGKFRKTVGKPIVGDRVQLEVQPDGTGYLMSIAPRRNSLIRPAVANLDLVVAVASAAPPVTDPFLIDKVTAIAVHKEITPLVVINKTDADAGDELYETYRKSGIEVLRVSARTGEGIDALRERICGKVSAFAGNSGVGKSSVLNRLDSSFGAEVGAISDRIGRGRHTTRHVELHPRTTATAPCPSRAAAISRTRRAFLRSRPSRWISCWHAIWNTPFRSSRPISASADSPAAPMSRKRAAPSLRRSKTARSRKRATKAMSNSMKA